MVMAVFLGLTQAQNTSTETINTTREMNGQGPGGPNGPRRNATPLKTALESNCYSDAEKQMIREVSEKFTQAEFTGSNGVVVKYNLFVPENYDPSQSYPLVLFVHDAGPLSEDTKTTLLQGTGAIYFASPEDQAKHPCFVLAPQYARVMTDAESDQAVATYELLDKLCTDYNIDRNRLYNTGQSMGGMFALSTNITHPDLFAASYLVACQWDTKEFYKFASKPMWVVVAEGDPRAYPGMQEACEAWSAAGAKIVEEQWDGSHMTDEYAEDVKRMKAMDANIRFVHFKLGTVKSTEFGGPAKEHMASWPVAYRISGIRDWLFEQRKQTPEEQEATLAQLTAKTEWVDPIINVPQGCQYMTYPTTSRGENTLGSCMIYLPPEYHKTEDRYPVIYYLHGGTGNQREGRWLTKTVDAAIRAGKMNPVIIVCPQALPIGWYINANVNDPKVTSGPVEDVMINDLIPYIDSHYRTIATREGRGIEGFSMGGRGTILLAFKHHDLFCAASSVAGALVNWDEEPLKHALECTFGDADNPYSKIYFDAWHPQVFACQHARHIIQEGMKIRMFVGDKDRLYEENGHHITQRFHELLENLQIPHSFTIVPGANHNPAEIFAEEVNAYDTSFWDQAFSSK